MSSYLESGEEGANTEIEKECDSETEFCSMNESPEIHYSIVEEGTKRGRPKLFDSDGYSYCMKDQRDKKTHWTCSVRGKVNPCRVRVIQTGEDFVRHQKHNHAAKKFDFALVGKQNKHGPKPEKSKRRGGPRRSALIKDTKNSIQCTVIEGGTKRGKAKLFDSNGYSYAMRGKRNDMTFWTCTIRRKGFRCPASVTQFGEGDGATFVKGRQLHNHSTDRDARKVTEMSVKIKKKAVEEPFKSALQIVREVYSQDEYQNDGNELPKLASMAHKASHFRRSCLPKEPLTLDFELVQTSLPSDFLLKDMRVDHHRHIVFATTAQLNLLGRASTWYIDVSNTLVKKPFTRLLTCSVFLHSDQTGIHHLPLLYCFMSKQRQQDYKAVMEVIRDSMRSRSVSCLVTGFEKGQWKACQEVFPDVLIRGCAYNFGLGIHQKIKSMGLEDEYSTNVEFQNYVQKLKSLPYLHANHIVTEFMYLRSQGEDPSVRGLINFIDDNWILSTEWGISTWSIFKTLCRLKGDCEGGGLAVGTVLLVEEDTYGSYANLLVKYFLAEAMVTGQSSLFATLDNDPSTIIKELPAPITDEPKETGTESGDSESMKIAWRYQNQPRVQSNQASVKFGHYYDLTRCMPQETTSSADITTLSSRDFVTSPECSSFMNPCYCQLLWHIQSRIEAGKFGTDQQCDRRNILRIAVQSLASPLWGENGGVKADGVSVDHSLHRLLYALRAMLRTAYASCLITVPSHLFHDQGFVDGLEHLSDTVIHLESFAGSSKEKNPAYREYHEVLLLFGSRNPHFEEVVINIGLLHIRQLPRLNSLLSHMPDTLDLAFKLRRKKFTIEKLHLPPELSETASRDQEDPAPRFKPPSLACGGPSSKLDF